MTAGERLRQARESLEEARILEQEEIGTKPVLAQLYHGMMNCLFALLAIREIGSRTHAEVIDRFEREDGTWATEEKAGVLAALRRAYDLTHECDCGHMPVPTKQEIAEIREAAERLADRAERYLGEEVLAHENGSL